MKLIRNWFPHNILARDLAIYFGSIALLSMITLGRLALLPSDGGVLFGLSVIRLMQLVVHLLIVILSLLLALNCRKEGRLYQQVRNHFANGRGRVSLLMGSVVAVLGITSMVIIKSLQVGTGEYRFSAYSERLMPALLLLIASVIGWYIIAFRHDAHLKDNRISFDRKGTRVWLGVWISLAVIWIFAWLSGIGLVPDEIGWEAPTVPLMEWQILVAWLAAGIFLSIRASRLKEKNASVYVDIIIMVCLWFSAVAIWASQPVPDSFFAIQRAPNFEVYPFSDGQFYDVFAQNLLVGNGFKGNEIPPRPLYILMLAGFHFLGGQDYSSVIFVQTLVLAFLPVGLYLVGKELHSRAAGIFIAGMAILRELTSIISTSFTDNISNSKLYFADLPTALIIVWLVWVVIRWLKCSKEKPWLGMLAGGMVGLSLLYRTQTIFFIPVFFVFLLIYLKGWRRLVGQTMLFFCGMVLTVAPWLIRSNSITGQFVFDHAESQTRVMALRYLPTHISPDQLPGESIAEYNDRLFGIIIQTTLDDPGYVSKFVLGHWINSEIGNLLVLPVRNGLASLREVWLPTYAFWQDWEGDPNPRQIFLMLVNLTIISIGIAAAFKKVGTLAFLPLALNFSYNLSNAVARNSGLRYLLPTDWVGYAFYAIGITHITFVFLKMMGWINNVGDEPQPLQPCGTPLVGYQRILRPIIIGILFLTIGFSLIMADQLITPRYPKSEREIILNDLFSSTSVQEVGISPETIADLVGDPNFRLTWGTGLYPIYYSSGEGEERTAKTGYAPDEKPRLVLILVGTTNTQVILHLSESPGRIPNGARMIVLGCRKELHTQAAIIYFPQTDLLLFDPSLFHGCLE